MNTFIYVTLDLRRALYVPEATGAIILCSYKSDLLELFRKNGHQVFCFEEACPEEKVPSSSAELIGNGKSLQFLKSLGKPLTFLVFKPSNKVRKLVESQGWTLISSDVQVCRTLEDKLEFPQLANRHGITIPRYEIHPWKHTDIPNYQQQFGNPFLVQSRIGHAGSSTWIIRDGTIDGPNERGGILENMPVKISEFISGPTYTINGYVSQQGKLAFGPLFEQLMNVPAWNEYRMGTIGISPADLSEKALEDLKNLLLKLSPLFKEVGFFGFFGIDLIFDGKQWTFIECNPRFIASISLQCFLDLQAKHEPLLKMHAEQAAPEEHSFHFLKPKTYPLNPVSFGHIILRNTTGKIWTVPKHLQSGIFALKSGDWKFLSADIDASRLNAHEVLFILAHEAGKKVQEGSDIATIVYRGSAFENDQIRDLFFDFYERVLLGYKLRPKDFLKDCYVKIESQHPVPVLADPSRKQLQTELFPSEVVMKLGTWRAWHLMKKADGTKGWIKNDTEMTPSAKEKFILPGKKSCSAEIFLSTLEHTRYRYGGISKRGIDCSGLVQRYFWEVKGKLLPKHSQDQKKVSVDIVKENLQDDDLVFLYHPQKNLHHVGLHRNGKLWHASLESGVAEEDLEEVCKRYQLEGFGRV